MYCAEIDSPLADTLTQYIARGNEMQMSDKAFREELLSWMRFNSNQVKKMGDGLSTGLLQGDPYFQSYLWTLHRHHYPAYKKSWCYLEARWLRVISQSFQSPDPCDQPLLRKLPCT